MKRSIAELITRDPEKFAHHDRVFKNNPVVMQGMGLAPLVVLATTGKNALMLAVAVALLLTPSRMLACLVSRLFPLRDEQPAPEELEKKLLPRALVYSGSAAVVDFTGKVQRMARVHQYGLKDRPNRNSRDVQYEARPLLGFTRDDEQMIEDVIIRHLGK